MAPRRDDDEPLHPPTASHLGQLARGIVIAAACDAAVTIPWALVRRVLRPVSLVSALEVLLLATNILAGYVGGRAAARAGLAHDDARAHWTMAWVVTVLSLAEQVAVQFVRPASVVARATVGAHSSGAMVLESLVGFGIAVALVRFGYAMGTWVQARREGRVADEDEESLE